MATPEGAARVQRTGQAGTVGSSPGQSGSRPPAGCGAIPKPKLKPIEVLRCAELAILESSGVRVESYVHVVDQGARDPRIKVEAEAIYEPPSSVRIRTDLSLRDVSQLRSEVVHVEDERFTRSESYNMVSGRRVVSDGWKREQVDAGDRRRMLDGVSVQYLVRLAFQRTGLVSPDITRCADDVARFLDPEGVGGRLYHVVEIRSADTTESGEPCVNSARTATTHWIDVVDFRPWRIVMESVPPEGAGSFGEEAQQARWSGQTLYRDFDARFQIEPPVASPP